MPNPIADLDFASGTWLKSQTPAGKWDNQELSGVTNIAVVSSTIPGFTKMGRFRMAPGTQTDSGLHNRALVDMSNATFGITNGTEMFISGAFLLPVAGNTNGTYRGTMLFELIHNQNGVVHDVVAPIGFFVNPPTNNDKWNGTSWGNPSDTTTPAICLRFATGYVPNQRPGGGKPATNPAFWHPNVPAMQPVQYGIPIWFVIHYIGHEYANGSPPGGYTIGTSPNFTGADTSPGTMQVWMFAKATQPVAGDFDVAVPLLSWTPASGTGVPTLVYGDNGSGGVIHDLPYGPFIGSYDSAPTINYNSEIDWVGLWLAADFNTAVSKITGSASPPPTPPVAPPSIYIGKNTAGTTTTGDLHDYKRGSVFTVSQSGTIASVYEYITGAGSAVKKKSIICLVVGGVPTTLLGTSSEVTIGASQAAGWQLYTFVSPVTVTAGQQILIGTICDTPDNAATSTYDIVTGALFVRADTYADGASDPWSASAGGGFTGTYDQQLAICAALTPTSPGPAIAGHRTIGPRTWVSAAKRTI